MPDFLRQAVRRGVDPNVLDATGRSSVFRGFAFINKQDEPACMKWLLAHGLDVFHRQEHPMVWSLFSFSQAPETATMLQEKAIERLALLDKKPRAALLRRLTDTTVGEHHREWIASEALSATLAKTLPASTLKRRRM